MIRPIAVGVCVLLVVAGVVMGVWNTIHRNFFAPVDEKDATLPEQTPCIRCGKCIDACPLNLMPVEYARALAVNDFALLEKRKVNLCMECGCCSFVCPARRPLVENNKLAKAALRKYQAEKNGGNK